MEKLKVQISNRQKQVKIPSGTRLLLRRCCHAVLAYEKFEKPAEVSISFIDNREIKHLNAEFRGKDIETDVLSFPLGENGIFDKNEDTGAYMLGDIVISVEKATAQAELYGHSFQREMGFLTVHGAANYLLFKVPDGSRENLGKWLLKRGIMLRCCDDYENLDGTFYRIGMNRHEENRKLLEALKEWIK